VLDDPALLERLEARASDNAFQQQFRAVKYHNKVALGGLIGDTLKSESIQRLFDVQIKRITNTSASCSTCWRPWRFYHTPSRTSAKGLVPRVKIFAGKAAASYRYAKLINQADQRRRRHRQQRS